MANIAPALEPMAFALYLPLSNMFEGVEFYGPRKLDIRR
jgi:hypothetical protein